jgi:hypothetical protein
MTKQNWTEAQITGLHKFIAQGMYARSIAAEIGKSEPAVRAFCKTHGITLPKHPSATTYGKKLSNRNGRMKSDVWIDDRIEKDQFLAAYEGAGSMIQLVGS